MASNLPVPLGERPVFNPFKNTTPNLSISEWLKIILLGPILIPIRMLLILIFCIIWGGLAHIVLIGYTARVDAPMEHWRYKYIVDPFTRAGAYFLLFTFGIYHVSTKGKKAPSSVAPIVVSNHLSLFDPIFLASQGCSHVSKAEVGNMPFAGILLKAMQCVLVQRGDKASCEATKVAINHRAKSMGVWPSLCIYPEGTISNGRSVLAFKHGPFYPGVPVQPVVLRFRYLFFDPTWTWGSKMYLLRLLSKPIHYLEAEFLPVHTPTNAEKALPSLFAENVRREMAAALNVPMSDFGIGDFLLELEAWKQNLPHETGNIETNKIQGLFDLQLNDIKEYLKRFSQLNTKKDGRLTLDEFREGLGDSVSPETALRLFLKFDQSQEGTIDFRAFLAGMMFINDSISLDETTDMAWALMDFRKEGKVTKARVVEVMQNNLHATVDANTIPDTDGKGIVTREQFQAFMSAHADILSGPRKTQLLEQFKQRLDKQFFGHGTSASAAEDARKTQ
eukprot:m.1136003 g.1136003  ORF g.1136003 m.1136003 type:complete len:505 (-) comp24430_c1_seq4:2681-4195(-)